MKHSRILLAGLVCSALPAAAQDKASRDRPNIILIVSDDQGYGDVGCYGSKEAVTPHLDKLASGGVRLTDFYVTHPSCTPSRTGLLTGRYPQRTGTNGALVIESHAAFSKDGKWHGGMPASEITLGNILKNDGYATGCFGKWHLGYGPGQQPKDRGFDHSFICSSGHVDFYSGEFFGKPDMYRDGKLEIFSGYTTDAFADAAIGFIREKKDQPFFVYLPFNAVHYSVPSGGPDGDTKRGDQSKNIVQVPEADRAEFAKFPRQRQYYLGALKRMDSAIGRLSAELDKLGLADNTLVIFFSDNGGDLKFGANNGSLRGEKAQLWEGGIRVPSIVRWPGKIPANTACHEPLIQTDFFSMSLAAAGSKQPADRPIDGNDPTAVLTGTPRATPVPLYFKFGPSRAIRLGQYKLIQHGKGKPALFDLTADIGEKNNLSAKKPEIAMKLNRMLQDWEKSVPNSAK